MVQYKARLGFTKTGKIIRIPLTHTSVSAMTGRGKSTAVKRLVHEFSRQGIKFLLIDVKPERDFIGVGTEINAYLHESTAPLLLKEVLEGIAGWSLTGHFGTLLQICRGARDLMDVRANALAIASDPRAHGRKRDEADKLGFLLDELISQVSVGTFSETLQLEDRISVMNISVYDIPIQQLIVDSVLNAVLRDHPSVVVVLEEAIRFIPQNETSNADSTARRYVREGRARNNWLWISGQNVTEIDKRVLKQMLVWIMGQQMEHNEAVRIVKQIPMSKLKADDIKLLPKGWFYSVIADEDSTKVVKTFVWPAWMEGRTAMKLATGKMKMSQLKVKEDDTMGAAERAEIKRLGVMLADRDRKIRELEKRMKELVTGGQGGLRKRAKAARADEGERAEEETAGEAPDDEAPRDGEDEESSPAPAGQGEEEAPPVEDARSSEEGEGEEGTSYEGKTPRDVRVAKTEPSLIVEVRKETVDATDVTMKGRLALLLFEGWFKGSRTTTDLVKEAKLRGWGTWDGGNMPQLRRNLQFYCAAYFMRAVRSSRGFTFTALPFDKGRIKTKEVKG